MQTVEVNGKLHNVFAKGEEVVYTHKDRAPNGMKATIVKVYDLDGNGLPDGYYVRLEDGQNVDTSEEHLRAYVHSATPVVPTPAAPKQKKACHGYAVVVRGESFLARR